MPIAAAGEPSHRARSRQCPGLPHRRSRDPSRLLRLTRQISRLQRRRAAEAGRHDDRACQPRRGARDNRHRDRAAFAAGLRLRQTERTGLHAARRRADLRGAAAGDPVPGYLPLHGPARRQLQRRVPEAGTPDRRALRCLRSAPDIDLDRLCDDVCLDRPDHAVVGDVARSVLRQSARRPDPSADQRHRPGRLGQFVHPRPDRSIRRRLWRISARRSTR